MLDEIRELIEYNTWANTTMLDALRSLSDEDLHRDLGSSFPSVHRTLVHMAGAEWIWLLRWRGERSPPLPDSWGGDSLDELRLRWSELQGEQLGFAHSLTEEQLSTNVHYRNLAGASFTAPLWQLIRHAVNHATYHRGQITTLMRQMGYVPANTDLVRFHRQIRTARKPA